MTRIDNTMDILNLQLSGLDKEAQQIVFTINNEEFGVDILKIQEIVRYITPVKVPNAPNFVQGVINFRGEVIPVLDMRRIFGVGAAAIDEFTVIVVVEADKKTFGLIVDRVSDIISLQVTQIQQTPEFSTRAKTQYLKAMGKLGERLIMLLDLEKLIDFREIDESLFHHPNDSQETAETEPSA